MIVSPSLLSADFLHLGQEIEMINGSEAEWLHFDVMDGAFVPNISFGFPVMQAVAAVLKKKLDVHFMIEQPWKYIQRTADLGAMMMTVHHEACRDNIVEVAREIRKAGMKAGVTINPDTSVEVLEEVISEVDMVLVMGVFPGFGGQEFIPETIDRVKQVKALIEKKGADAIVEVDGGVNGANAADLVAAGADVLVSGNYIFKSENPRQTIAELKAL